MNTRSSQPSRSHRSNGLTLVELVVVLAILVALAGLVTPRLLSTAETARETATQASAVEIRNAVMQFWSDCKYSYPTDFVRDQRIQLAHLLEQPITMLAFDPNSRLGWNGPYLQSDGRNYTVDSTTGFTATYGDFNQPAIRDSFSSQDYDGDGKADSGSPFIIQEPTLRELESTFQTYSIGQPREVRVVSAGADGVLEIDERLFSSQLEANPTLKGDDIYVSFILR